MDPLTMTANEAAKVAKSRKPLTAEQAPQVIAPPPGEQMAPETVAPKYKAGDTVVVDGKEAVIDEIHSKMETSYYCHLASDPNDHFYWPESMIEPMPVDAAAASAIRARCAPVATKVPAALAAQLKLDAAAGFDAVISAVKGLQAEASEQHITATGNVETMRAEIDRMTGEVATLTATRDQMADALTTAQAQVKVLETKVDAMQAQVITADRQVADAELRAEGVAKDQREDLVNVVLGAKYRPEGTSIRDAIAAHKAKAPSAYVGATVNKVSGSTPTTASAATTPGESGDSEVLSLPGIGGPARAAKRIAPRAALPAAALERQNGAGDDADDLDSIPGIH